MFLKSKIIFLILLTCLFAAPIFVFASTGTIDSTNKYAWSGNAGWINFGCSGCNVQVTDSALTGYAWSQNYGWINLSPANGGVVNNTDGVEGKLSGNAWGQNTGWIDFSGSSINTGNGNFSGTATGNSVVGIINFDCTETGCPVTTTWSPTTITPPPTAVLVQTLTLNESSATLTVGATDQLTVTISPANATNKNVVWATGNKDVATVTDGLITAVGPGSAVIEVSTVDGSSPQAADVITVNSTSAYVPPNGGGGGVNTSAASSYSLNVFSNNGTVIKNPDKPSYEKGSSVTLTAKPNSGYVFSNWSGDFTGIPNPAIIIMNNNETITANYKPVTVNLVSASSVSIIPAQITFTTDLKMGDSLSDVKYLQMFLNSNGFILSSSGVGAVGHETNFFGNLTFNALSKFQKQYSQQIGLSYTPGVLDTATRTFINSFIVTKESETADNPALIAQFQAVVQSLLKQIAAIQAQRGIAPTH